MSGSGPERLSEAFEGVRVWSAERLSEAFEGVRVWSTERLSEAFEVSGSGPQRGFQKLLRCQGLVRREAFRSC